MCFSLTAVVVEWLLRSLLVMVLTGVRSAPGRSSTPVNSDAAVSDDTTHSSSSSSATSSSYPSVVTPSLVSAVCSLLSNLLTLAPRDVSAAIRQHGILQALMQFVALLLLSECSCSAQYGPRACKTRFLCLHVTVIAKAFCF